MMGVLGKEIETKKPNPWGELKEKGMKETKQNDTPGITKILEGEKENSMENLKELEQECKSEKLEVSEQKSETKVLETAEKNEVTTAEEKTKQRKGICQMFAKDERGIGVVEIILILVILIGLVLLFQTQIKSVVSNALNQVTSGAGRVTL